MVLLLSGLEGGGALSHLSLSLSLSLSLLTLSLVLSFSRSLSLSDSRSFSHAASEANALVGKATSSSAATPDMTADIPEARRCIVCAYARFCQQTHTHTHAQTLI